MKIIRCLLVTIIVSCSLFPNQQSVSIEQEFKQLSDDEKWKEFEKQLKISQSFKTLYLKEKAEKEELNKQLRHAVANAAKQ